MCFLVFLLKRGARRGPQKGPRNGPKMDQTLGQNGTLKGPKNDRFDLGPGELAFGLESFFLGLDQKENSAGAEGGNEFRSWLARILIGFDSFGMA